MRLKFLCFTLIFFNFTAYASNVYWGGVSFSGWENKESKYPFTSSFLCIKKDCVNGNIDGWALSSLKKNTFNNFVVSTETIGADEIEGVILTPMINAETVSIYKDVTGKNISYIHIYRVYASLVFFEFGSKRFIAAYPSVMQFTDVLPEPASNLEKIKRFKEILNPNTTDKNLFDVLFAQAKNAIPFSFSDKYSRVSDIEVSDNILNQLPSNFNLNAWKDLVKRQTEAYLVDKSGAALVPSMSNDSAATEFTATFANASTKIELPDEVPFNFIVKIDNFKKIEKINRKQKTLCHAVALQFSIQGMLDEILNERLARTRESCSLVSSDKNPDDIYYFTTSLLSLINKTTQQLDGSPESSFFKLAAPKSKNIKNKFKTAWEKVIQTSF